MKKIISFLILFLIFIIPINTKALTSDYEDKLYELVGVEKEKEKVNIYLFYGDACSYCKSEIEFLKEIENNYKDKVNIYYYEISNNKDNHKLMLAAKEIMNIEVNIAVPLTVIGNNSYVGYGTRVERKLKGNLEYYLELKEKIDDNKEYIPILGEIDKKDASILLIAIILGFIDGFNPCAMWILLFLINMLIGIKDKKKMIVLGFAFLIASSLAYFVALLGISGFLNYISSYYKEIRKVIGVFAIILGLYNLWKYYSTRNEEAGCEIIDDKKRKKVFNRIKKFIQEKNVLLALLGVVLLAISVNIVEIACSTVFPAMFINIMQVNNVVGLEKIIYLLIYVLFYMLDDLIIFLIAIFTLRVVATGNKYSKYFKLISGIIMFIIGILLIFKPQWLSIIK